MSEATHLVALLILFGLFALGLFLPFWAWKRRARRLSDAELHDLLRSRRQRRRALRIQDAGPLEPDARRHELAVLRFCLDELKKRETEDAELSWLWSLKREVAEYAAQRLETHVDPQADVPALSESEKQAILRDHPLLQPHKTEPLDTRRYANEPWFEEIQAKISRYTESVQARGTD